jgi:DNA-binding NarL/FixJ family response regulator
MLLLPAICTRLRLRAEPLRTLEPAMPWLHLQIEAGSPTRGAQFRQHMTKETKVLLLQNSQVNAETIVHELSAAGMEVHQTMADNPESVKSALAKFEPDVVLTDYLPGEFGACEVLDVLRYESPETPLIVITESVTGVAAVACLRNGAEDIVIMKNIRRLPSAISAAIERRSPLAKLTSRQIEILRMVAEGHRTREIADQLRLSVKTVESHRGEVMKRLGMHDVVSLVRYALRVGLIPVTP